MPIEFQKFIERNQQICAGEPVIRGTRVTVRTILASLAEGASIEEIVMDFPTVSQEAVRAVIAYAAASAEEDLPAPSLPVPGMKFKLDENLPESLLIALSELKHDASGSTFFDVGLKSFG